MVIPIHSRFVQAPLQAVPAVEFTRQRTRIVADIVGCRFLTHCDASTEGYKPGHSRVPRGGLSLWCRRLAAVATFFARSKARTRSGRSEGCGKRSRGRSNGSLRNPSPRPRSSFAPFSRSACPRRDMAAAGASAHSSPHHQLARPPSPREIDTFGELTSSRSPSIALRRPGRASGRSETATCICDFRGDTGLANFLSTREIASIFQSGDLR